MFSAGIGWEYGRHGQWATDLFAGFIPASAIGRTYPTTTAKQSYTPWSIRCCRERLSVEPLTCGMYINSVIADEFWLREPSRYPKGYYGFSTKLRARICSSGRATASTCAAAECCATYRYFGR